jgi:hypothetical protein
MCELKNIRKVSVSKFVGAELAGPRLIKKEFTGPRSDKGWETLHWSVTKTHSSTRACPRSSGAHTNTMEKIKFPTRTGNRLGRDSSVGIGTGYGLDGPGIESRWVRDFTHPSRRALGSTQPHTMSTGSFPGGKQPWRDVDHPPHLAPRLEKE